MTRRPDTPGTGFKRLFAYDAWGNREALASLTKLAHPPEAALELMAHIVGAEWLWLLRLKESGKKMAVWPALDLHRISHELSELENVWRRYLEAVGEKEVSSTIRYVNSKGEPWTSRVDDVLTHVVMHSAYHRGQIASSLRRSGHEPAYTDYVHATRRGWIT